MTKHLVYPALTPEERKLLTQMLEDFEEKVLGKHPSPRRRVDILANFYATHAEMVAEHFTPNQRLMMGIMFLHAVMQEDEPEGSIH